MRIIAADPGYDKLGLAIIEHTSGKDVLLHSECFRTNTSDEFPLRLCALGKRFVELLETFSPDSFATEKLFLTNNHKTAMRVAEVRGALSYLAAHHNISIFEYTPQEIKAAVAGHGRGTKLDIARMLPKLLVMRNDIKEDDEYDAIAVGLTHTSSHREALAREIRYDTNMGAEKYNHEGRRNKRR